MDPNSRDGDRHRLRATDKNGTVSNADAEKSAVREDGEKMSGVEII